MPQPQAVRDFASKRSRSRSIVLGMVFLLATIVGLAYHLLAWAGGPPSAVLTVFHQAAVLIGFASLWVLVSDLLGTRRPTAARTFWSLFLAAVVTTVVSSLVLLIARPAQVVQVDDPTLLLGFDLQTHVPLVLATVFKMNILSLVQGTFAVFLMLRIRDLVLVKRTRSSQRNWNLMVGLMVLAALSAGFQEAGTELGEIQTIAMIVAVVFMVVNSFRLSWIVFLSFREKMASIGLAVLLLTMLGLGVGVMGDSPVTSLVLPGAHAYVDFYSFPLSIFASQAAIFGILYCTTALLSLLFHLPTTGEFEQRAGERAAMSSISHLVGDVLDQERLYAAIASSPIEAGIAHSAFLAVADPDSGSLRPRIVAAHGMSAARFMELVDLDALYEEVAAARDGSAVGEGDRRPPMLLNEAPADHRIRARPGDGVGSLFVVPLVARDRMLGALIATKNVVHGFERDELETGELLASQAALAIENARLFEQQVEKERLARELSIAREVQQRLLPQTTPRLRGLSLAASSVSALEVGGDYYDFARVSEDQLGIIIADVSGKGTSAAFYMAEMQGIFHALTRLAPEPREFLCHANGAIAESLERSVFVSVVYGLIDVAKEEFVLARAGHCPVAVAGIDAPPSYLRTRGIGLGLDRGVIFRDSLEESRIALKPGDVFVMYTDGVVESRSRAGEEYGYDRLLASLKEHRQEEAQDIHDAIIRDLRTFIGNMEYDDDMTLVVLKWHGLPLGAEESMPDESATTIVADGAKQA